MINIHYLSKSKRTLMSLICLVFIHPNPKNANYEWNAENIRRVNSFQSLPVSLSRATSVKFTSEVYRCWLIPSTFSSDILSFVLTFWWRGNEMPRRGILETPQKSDLCGLAAAMAYIMEFKASGAHSPLTRPTGPEQYVRQNPCMADPSAGISSKEQAHKILCTLLKMLNLFWILGS